MRVSILKTFLTLIFTIACISVSSQDTFNDVLTNKKIIDSLRRNGVVFGDYKKKPEISLSIPQAIQYLQQRYHPQMWNNTSDPLRQAFEQLIYEAAHPPLDSLRTMLIRYPYDSLSVPWTKFYIWEPMKLRIPVVIQPIADSILKINPDLISGKNDSLGLRPFGDNILAKDTTILVIADTLKEVSTVRSGFPFKYSRYPFQGDSIQAAVKSILNYIDKRDSSIVSFTGIGKTFTPMVLNSTSERVIRYWLKNEFSDSVAVWIGNPSRNTIGLYLEQGVYFRRPARQGNYAEAKIDVKKIDTKKLQDLQNITVITQFWKYRTEASFVLNQAALSNWVKGGESSISTALDITGYADYKNKDRKISSNNFARLKFGYIASGKNGVIKNLDLLETNSKLNHLAFGKVDFSAILLFKTQIAKGKNFFKTPAGEDTSSVVSKFMNPATLTIGLGFDYKPDKKTSINFSPLSYKSTLVTDPAYYNEIYDSTRIDQTKYGIAKNKKSLNEPGASFMITNEFKANETLTIVNRLQLFTNYIHNPQNVDVDWEMIVTAKLNWFIDVRFNTHLIFDDDTKTDELLKNGQPVLRPDGTQKKTARLQFKEMLGFAVSFRF